MSDGWVYVLSNEHMPGIVKIGQTANEPSIRASELHTTGVPGAFEIEYKGFYDGYARLERSVHGALAEHRVSANREFFRIDVARAVLAIRKAAINPPKFEELKEDCLRQLELVRRQANEEETRRRERQRIHDEDYTQAREKMLAHNSQQKLLVNKYVDDMHFDLWPIVLIVSFFLVSFAFIVNVFLGVMAIIATYVFGKSIEVSQKAPIEAEAKKKFPNKNIEDYLKKDNEINQSPILSSEKFNKHILQIEPINLKSSAASGVKFKCRKCESHVKVPKAIGFLRVDCDNCKSAYIYDRPSYNNHPEIYDRY